AFNNYPTLAADYIQCSAADCSQYRAEGLSGGWYRYLSMALDTDGLPHIMAQTASQTAPIKHIRRPVSATISVRALTGQRVSGDDAAGPGYIMAENTTNLGPIIGSGLYIGCFVGTETVG